MPWWWRKATNIVVRGRKWEKEKAAEQNKFLKEHLIWVCIYSNLLKAKVVDLTSKLFWTFRGTKVSCIQPIS